MLLPLETQKILGVDPSKLKPLSNRAIIVKCDYCGEVFQTKNDRWRAAQKHNRKTACKRCRNKKREETTQILHGVKNVSQKNSVIKKRERKWKRRTPEQKEEFKKSVRAGLLQNQGFIPFESPEFQKRIQDKREERTGFRNPWNNPEILTKRKETFLRKYGHKTPAKSQSVKKQIHQTRVSSGKTRIVDGKNLKEIAKENDFSYSGLCLRIRKFGLKTLENLEKRKTGLEVKMEQILLDTGVAFEFRKRIDKREIDFFLPDHNLGIETDGLYWHSDAKEKNKQYHKEKKEHFGKYGVEVLFFREDEIVNKIHIVKSIIANKIGKSHKTGARKTSVKTASNAESKEFFESNHLMGAGRGKTLVLEFEGEILAALQYFIQKGEIEISRFCCKINNQVTGGLSKLLKEVRTEHPNKRIVSFVDLRYGNGQSLEKLGFKKTTEHLSFKWTKNFQCFHRLKYRGNSGYNQRMNKIWDCGQAKFVLEIPTPIAAYLTTKKP